MLSSLFTNIWVSEFLLILFFKKYYIYLQYNINFILTLSGQETSRKLQISNHIFMWAGLQVQPYWTLLQLVGLTS